MVWRCSRVPSRRCSSCSRDMVPRVLLRDAPSRACR
jgi:hypothetical protein